MKIQLSIIAIASALCFVSCNKKVAVVEEVPEPVVEVAPAPVVEAPVAVQAPASYRMIGLKRGACYGQCPVFEINFFSDGVVTYEGKQHVEKIGLYESTMDKNEIARLLVEARNINIFDLSDVYPADKQFINDLPTHQLFVQEGNRSKKIKDNYGAPSELKAFEEMLERSVDGLTWTKIN